MPTWSVILNEAQKAQEKAGNNPLAGILTLCAQADELAEELTEKILKDKDIVPEIKERIKNTFAKNEDSKTHSRHFDRDKCKAAGLDVIDLETNNELQDIVLSIHHCCMILAEKTPVIKVVENNIGGCYVRNASMPVPAQVQ